jgi:hypothetical protein
MKFLLINHVGMLKVERLASQIILKGLGARKPKVINQVNGISF